MDSANVGNSNAKPRVSSSSTSGGRTSRATSRGRLRKSADLYSTDETETESSASDICSSATSSKRRKSARVAKANVEPKKTRPNNRRNSKIDVYSTSEESEPAASCLPRTRELCLKSELDNENLIVIGVDEAGRGPLAGPVCAAAAYLPVDVPGITDSKKITKEDDREALYGRIMAAPGLRWAAAIVDAKRIDEINILQATMEAMRMATASVMNPLSGDNVASEASVDRLGCYVVCGANDDEGITIDLASVAPASLPATSSGEAASHYALIDGNRVPTDMPCDAEPLVKGDSREFSIGAASIIAKVTRDRLMHAYNAMYPEYNLAQHKGYPTAAHMAAVRTHGASPIHRRTFAPLKHMSFDEEGRIVEE